MTLSFAMNTIKRFSFLAIVTCATVLSQSVDAMTLDWSGTYRFEYVQIDRPSLGEATARKYYALNHLNFGPRIVANDGVNIVANFQVFPNETYSNSQLGMSFGSLQSNASQSTATSQSQQGSNIQVNQLYATINQEYGQFAAGRMPIHFGLGLTHNSGQGLFDHWYNTHDLVGYKVLVGNLSVMPMIGRSYKASNAQGTETGEVMWDIEYNNPETESVLGVFHQIKSGSVGANDAWKTYGSTSADATSGFNSTQTSVYLARGWQPFKFRLEAGFLKGNTGVTGTTGVAGSTAQEIGINSYGVIMEMDFPRPESKFQWSLKTGIASGDNPTTIDDEGFYFNKNYDLAFLMFNHRMGQADLFRTNRNRKICNTSNVCSTTATADSADDESVSNAWFVVPKLVYSMNDKWDWTNSIAYAQLNNADEVVANNSPNKDLGWEWDTGFVYKPNDRYRWITEFGLFFPGQAWAYGRSNFDTRYNFGMQTKAAISF
jgi:hypothetical protein